MLDQVVIHNSPSSRVPESSTHCGVNLINKQWMQEGANVTLWFETFGPVDTVKCQANGRDETCKYMYLHALHEEIGTHIYTHTHTHNLTNTLYINYRVTGCSTTLPQVCTY